MMGLAVLAVAGHCAAMSEKSRTIIIPSVTVRSVATAVVEFI